MSPPSDQRTVYAIGLGIRVPDHLTLEAVEALQRCNRLFSILPRSTLSPLPEDIRDKIESLEPHYAPGVLRSVAYERQIEMIVAASSTSQHVGYVTVGNPVFFDSVTEGLRTSCAAKSVQFVTVAGVSSIDSILIDLGCDVAPGLQIFEASSLVAFRIEPRTDLAAIIMQPNAFGTSFVVANRQVSADAMSVLREYLLRFYPPHHLVTYVTSAVRVGVSGELAQFPLEELGGTADRPQVPGASLYIPPSQLLDPDPAFLEGMADAGRYARSFH